MAQHTGTAEANGLFDTTIFTIEREGGGTGFTLRSFIVPALIIAGIVLVTRFLK